MNDSAHARQAHPAQRQDPADAERVFHSLAEGGRVMMPMQETFWAARFGMLIDRFGIPWMVNIAGKH